MKILLADDHALFRAGMRHVLARLADEVTVVEAGNFEEALDEAGKHDDLSLLLLDLSMPGQHGFAVLDVLIERHPFLPIVVLSASESRADMQGALDRGALGFIPKSATPAVMLSALQLVLSGGVYVPPELVERSAERFPATHIKLTPRQVDVLRCVIDGKSNKTIAAELGLTVATVKAHATAVFKALNVSNRTQAALAAERFGLTTRASDG